ncbi:MAG: Coq4 family protein [Pseudomonadota bacterium]
MPRPGLPTEQIPAEKIVWMNGYATPPQMRIKPVHAALSVGRLLANKEDTRQVFEIVKSLTGGAGKRFFVRFSETDYGRRVITEPIKVEALLGDRDALRALPEGSVGRAYLDFMEGEDLTPEGILDAAAESGVDLRGDTQFPEFFRAFLHIEIVHDLWHVLTGYGRDTLGELCLLAFTRAQTGNHALSAITGIGAIATTAEQPRQPIRQAISEGAKRGQHAVWFPGLDIEAMLPKPLEAVRAELNLTAPVIYNSVPADIRAGLLKPKLRQTQTERESGKVENDKSDMPHCC